MSLLPAPERIDEGKLWWLLVALLAMFLSFPLAASLGILRFHRLALVVVLVVAAYSVSGQRRILRIALVLGVPAVLAQLVATYVEPGPAFAVLLLSLSLAFIGFISLVMIGSVFRRGEITSDRIAGAICVFLLAGLVWAMLYGIVAYFDPAAFNQPARADEVALRSNEMQQEYVYFSFVTLTSLGYGDISPASRWAQTLAWMQAVFGQLYIAILLARLVSLHVAKTNRDAEERDGQ